tara:strand:+ start:383 stop:511 length:129 start_codon:yes stop_codon:yes gene_type:complete
MKKDNKSENAKKAEEMKKKIMEELAEQGFNKDRLDEVITVFL